MKASALNQLSQPIAAARSRVAVRWRSRWVVFALALGVFLLAFASRALALGDFVTIDEASKWFERSEGFLQALREGDFADTNQTGHPGVTTMWLGSAGVLAHQWLVDMGRVAPDDLTTYRVLLRLPVTFVTSLSVALGYLLLRRLLGARVALLAALLWATDPFLVAHGQVIHLDGLLTSFMTLSLLAAFLAFRPDDRPRTGDRPVIPVDNGRWTTVRWSWLATSALAGGLALLTKSPSVVLLPMIGLIALVGLWPTLSLRPFRAEHALVIASRAGTALVVWVSLASAVWFTLWPTTWVDPGGAVTSVVAEVINNGGEPHNVGNFFRGRAVDDPGPLFYPVVIALRLTPWTMLGGGLALVVFLVYMRANRMAVVRGSWSVILLLGVFALLFTLLMSIPPKKFDRYVLPIFPALTILAAFGYVWSVDALRRRTPGADNPKSKIQNPKLIWLLVVLGLVANLAWYHPYIFSYYNPLLGGGPVAARTIPVGWGEGYEQAGAFIARQFNGCAKPVASWFGPVLDHFVCPEVVPLGTLFEPDGDVGYAVLYIDQLQRNNEPEAIDLLYGTEPLHTVQIHGIEYAYVYQIAPPVERRLDADFGSAIHLRGYDVDVSGVRASGVLTLTLQWYVREPMAEDYMLFVHVLDVTGNLIGQVDVPPGGPGAPTSIWQPDRYVSLEQPVPLPADVPGGQYWISLGIYDPQTFARLPLRGPMLPGAPYDGPAALLVGPLALE